jgi:ComF family protein
MYEEAVFSSSEDRIRAGQATSAIAGPTIVCQGAPPSTAAIWLRHTAEGLFSVLFTSDCRICGLPLLNISRLPVCSECLTAMHAIPGRVCSICGERVLSSYAESDPDGLMRCPVCPRVDRAFSRAVAYGSYDGGLRELIHLLKYNCVRPASRVLGRMLAESLLKLESDFEDEEILIVPVPLYKGKRRQRGFNQTEMIALEALKIYPVKARFAFTTDFLVRIRDTHSQIGLTSHQRRENMRGAFVVSGAPQVTGRAIVIADDVYTTGTTVTECARVLRKAGAARVWVATVARTLKNASNNESFSVSEFQGVKKEAESEKKLEVENLETLKL